MIIREEMRTRNPRINEKSKALLISLLITTSLTAGITTFVPAIAIDAVYDDYVSFQVMPDESILLQLEGSDLSTNMYSGGGLDELLSSFHTEYICKTLIEGSSEIKFHSTLKLNPEEAAPIANLEFMIEGEGDNTHQIIEVFVDYPGFIIVDGLLEVNLDDPPLGGSIDVALSVTLYYMIYPQEQIEQMLIMLPLMETTLANEVDYYSGGNLTLSKLEVVNSEMGPVSATFSIEARLEGDFQKGMQAAVTKMGVDYAKDGYDLEKMPPLQLGSYRASLEYFKESFTFELMFEMTVLGQVDEWTNFVKNSALDVVLDEGRIDKEEEAVITEFLRPTELSVENLQFELDYGIMATTMTTSFRLEGLVLKPPSLEAFMAFLQYVSDEDPPEDFVLILEGGSSGSRNVVINSPEGTSTPVSQEPQRVVWSLANAENLDQVTFEIESPPESSTTDTMDTNLIIVAVGILIIISLAGYMMMRRKN